MKVAILAGGRGSRLSEETLAKPKPMVQIGGQPILWHIMRHYARFGFRDFVIALGYKGEMIKRFMVDHLSLAGNLRVDFKKSAVESHSGPALEWNAELIETGENTLTGGRIKRLAPFLGDSTFMLTWGDGVSDIDLDRLIAFHR